MFMKNTFDRLKNKYKILLICIFFFISLTLVISAFCIENNYIKILLGTISLLILCILFLMLIWFLMYKEKFNSKNKYENIDLSKQKDIIVEYSKVLENHYLKYVFVENLTLAENLDKINLGEENFIYVDEVDNKYDNEALALFYKDYKIGYFYKNGKFRDLYRKYRNDEDFLIITKVCHLDLTNNRIKLKIAFYKTLDSEKFITVNVSINNNNYDYLKVGYWLNVTKSVNAIGKKEYQIEDIYGKKLDVVEIQALDQYNNNFYGKILKIDNKIDLIIYYINK